MGVALLWGASRQTKAVRSSWGMPDDRAAPEFLMIALVMWPLFHQQVGPIFPRVFHKRYFTVATIHGALGMAAEFLGLYIVIVAGPPSGCVSSVGGCGCEWNLCFGRQFCSAACGPSTENRI